MKIPVKCDDCIATSVCRYQIKGEVNCIKLHKTLESKLNRTTKQSVPCGDCGIPNIVETISYARQIEVEPEDDYITAIVSKVYLFIVGNKKLLNCKEFC